MKFTYDEHDWQRFMPEDHQGSMRDSFARDRARMVHAAYMRRLADKTQVYSPLLHLSTVRNRLTHSTEVAQIGMDIAQIMGLNPYVVDTACLAHDIGHPPFGHNGERVLNAWAESIGGFEGNAQTFRVITRLEPKVYDETRSYGLNLTRVSLNAACKYPWLRADAPKHYALKPGSAPKFGVYAEDQETFEWVRQGSAPGALSIEAQIMDFSDDVAYSVHDFEDSLLLEPQVGEIITAKSLPGEIAEEIRRKFSAEAAAAAPQAFTELAQMWRPLLMNRNRRGLAQLKNLTSSLIGRFAAAAIEATQAVGTPPQRQQLNLLIPTSTQAEIAVLKSIVSALVMNRRTDFYALQYEALLVLVQKLWQLALTGEQVLDDLFYEDWLAADSQAQQQRVLLDQVASLTDLDAISLMQRYCLEADCVREFIGVSEKNYPSIRLNAGKN